MNDAQADYDKALEALCQALAAMLAEDGASVRELKQYWLDETAHSIEQRTTELLEAAG